MAYVESNSHMLDDVTFPVFLFGTHCVFHATFRIDKINWNYRKTANIIKKLKFTKQQVDILTRCSK